MLEAKLLLNENLLLELASIVDSKYTFTKAYYNIKENYF